MNTLKQFFKIPGTYVGIVVALAFQLIFFCVWLTAYDGVYERANEMRIAIVNQDANMGSKIAQGLQNNLPFQVKNEKSMEKAKEEMDKHVYDMIIEIPASFSKDISEKRKADLNFHINQASAMMAKQMMEGAAKQVRDNVNKEVSSYKQQAAAGKLQAMEPGSAEAIKGLTEDSVGFAIHKVNDAKGFSINMVPLMIVLASFVGAMIMSMELYKASQLVERGLGNFFSRQLINMVVAVILATITVILMKFFHIQIQESIFTVWLFQTIVFFAFLSLTQMFLNLFGNAGMLFNILSLSLQLVSAGVMVPHVMLSHTYQTIGTLLPATYAADGYYTIIFGGESLTKNIMYLCMIIVVTQIIAVIGYKISILLKRNQAAIKGNEA
ncbi:YhgE/Pip domain-containing protein [Bacillus sp. WLY-B-L8]|uniref:YhgE/Pip domain-containing protein n=1 Tax=Bacillus multifaciens TaxID=3068506 RepID=UPI0027424E06|nr:ABC transporter permease [Bacillus sp. WLY-B-L8]MDP7979811.1 ABC transporter permease [Bacillus sp. WLY-B-L8]